MAFEYGVLVVEPAEGHKLRLSVGFEHVSYQISASHAALPLEGVQQKLSVPLFALLVYLQDLRTDIFIYPCSRVQTFAANFHIVSLELELRRFDPDCKLEVTKSLSNIVEGIKFYLF